MVTNNSLRSRVLIKNLSLYQIHQGSIEICDDLLAEASELKKVTLFGFPMDKLPQEEARFISLLEKLKGETYFKKRQYEQLICWDLWAQSNQIDQWIDSTLRGSDFDFIIWPSGYQQAPKLLVFDMDSTFIEIEVIDELAKRHGVGQSVSEVTEAAMRGELDFSESLISRVACLKGLSVDHINQIAETLPLSKGVAGLVQACQFNQIRIAIVSGGFMPFVQHLKDKMRLYEVKANQLQVDNGYLTGKLDGAIIDAAAKAVFVADLAKKLALTSEQILTIGDGANDLKMMQASGFSLAYRAKPAVQKKALGRIENTHLGALAKVFDWSSERT